MNSINKVRKLSAIKQEKRMQACGFISKRENGINVIKRTEMFDWFRKNGHLFF